MTYKKPSVEEIREEPVFAGACGSYSSSCGQQVHKRTNTACGSYSSSCGRKVHKK
jgi:hypothetical protein